MGAQLTKKWVGTLENGHWEVSNGAIILTCEDSELLEMLDELKNS